MSDDVQHNRSTIAAIALFGIVVVLIGWDLWVDFSEGVGLWHLFVESFVLVVAAAGMVLMWRQLDRTRSELVEARVEAAQWKRESAELLKGLSAAIERQFGRWGLSAAESEVALLLLKGMSHKEIANIRQTSERTVREQGRAVYRKSGLGGRSSLAAFFLEDLLLPYDDA
ncbi:MAG: helix-turn-helix transcriptional regulator [Gammaproteobacteria bacterium]|nr:helix-turn-helix transcriptional regulator [Gammaproteobacteria bacterium]